MCRTPDNASSSGSVGHSEADSWDYHGHARPCFTALLNGLQIISCPIPEPGRVEKVWARAGDIAVAGANGGLPLDVYFCAPAACDGGQTWTATLTATAGGRCHTVGLGSLRHAGDSEHTGHHVPWVPAGFTLEVAGGAAAVPPGEQQLVKEVTAILTNPRLNRERGSLSSVLINNKAKESVLYDQIVGKLYGKSWSDFLAAHSDEFAVFHYSDSEVRALGLAPHIKRSDARVCLAGQARQAVAEADARRCGVLRESETELKQFLATTLAGGELSQRELLAKLRGCRGFTDSLFPTLSLLLRFLAGNSEKFTWASGPDLPARIGLARAGRYPHHEAPELFAKLRALADDTSSAVPSPVQGQMLVQCSEAFYAPPRVCEWSENSAIACGRGAWSGPGSGVVVLPCGSYRYDPYADTACSALASAVFSS